MLSAASAGIVEAALARLAEINITPRQTEVLQLSAYGLTTKQIAAELYLSTETVKHYQKEIRHRLRAVNTTNAVAIAMRRGLIL